MKKVLVISALVIALMAPAVPVAAATYTKAPAPVTSSHEVQVLKYISDHVALLKIPLPTWLHNLLNQVLKAIGPQLCSLVASLADPTLRTNHQRSVWTDHGRTGSLGRLHRIPRTGLC